MSILVPSGYYGIEDGLINGSGKKFRLLLNVVNVT
jgi:hypothetical protein